MYDFVIIGCGVIGSLIARELTKYTASICILERSSDIAMGSSNANSGIVHAGFDAEQNSLKATLNVRGAKIMPQLAQTLGVKYKNNGSLVIALFEDERKVLQDLYQRGIANGVENLEIIDKEKLKALEPNLTDDVKFALYAPTAGIICPYGLNIAACGNAMDNGAQLKLNFKVVKIQKNDDHFSVCSDTETVKARYVINTAGVYADEVSSLVGDSSYSIKPRKGEYLLLSKESGDLFSSTIFRVPTKMGKGILMTPTVDGNLLLGPTSVDIDDKEDLSVSQEGIESIISQAAENSKKIPFKNVITSFAGLRAHPDKGDFVIEESKVAKNFINVGGIESPGLSAAPAIAEYVVNLIKETGFAFTKNPNFNPYREADNKFQELSTDEKNQIIKKKPKYGKIICRCEGISEGEVLKAVHSNPKALTLDAVKRRTRCGMGMCQSGFCSIRIAEIIAEELKIPFQEVTKFGGHSYINVAKIK